MASSAATINPDDLLDFQQHLSKSRRIVALLGAGLSASSGLPTFRGAGGLWRTHDATSIATPEAFRADPAFVWQFYSYRRHMALNANPNRAHLALAALARVKRDFITLSQNVDGLSPRAYHPPDQLKLLHGNLFDVKCADERRCGYSRRNDFTDPIVPALAIPQERVQAEKELQTGKYDHAADTSLPPSSNPLIRGADISNVSVPLPQIPLHDLPRCPKCESNLLRPGVVWFGESLPSKTMQQVDAYFADPDRVDLMLVIGTSAKVYPAAGYTEIARAKGARVCVVNMDPGDRGMLELHGVERDWFFEGDAAVIVPELFKDAVGPTPTWEEAVDEGIV